MFIKTECGLKIRWGAIPVWVRVPPPVPVPENQRLSFINLPPNRPSFNKSFNTSPRVSAILTPSLHAIARGDGCFRRLPLAMLIPQLEGVLWCSVSLQNTPAIRSHKGRGVSYRRSVSGIRWTHLRGGQDCPRCSSRARVLRNASSVRGDSPAPRQT